MFETIAIINFIVWVSLFIIMLIGNLTYADYYTKFDEDLKMAAMITFLIAIILFLLNFIIAAGMEGNVEAAFKYGLFWFSCVSFIMYICFTIYGLIYGFQKLKSYFGKKRGKI
jgi:p-aminobenzoyl-glutamate transporter AbgT